jgi:putative transposase
LRIARSRGLLKWVEAGTAVTDLSREHWKGLALFYNWLEKCGGMDVFLMAPVKELEQENRRLKKL